ncbi:hypothetical protein LTR99_002854 [Exophiala xenobiotica]|uniref:Bacteriophage T5 Orf172 DNA-binding domain-containing protein n=1 Tax=Vermiconidia calcicola TaxID=1690605 RepID=A0AAV9Q8T9_9PEZI|nr:hypothetical protein LTR99_002854 [Exophiala xenobiotica]KAK5426384.1 hypothetical protein LTR34_010070 [Exophiala xenobiotica]KAK5538524.1 hypothetical protein LTR25_004066 [Vermiconidia calcicola]KAK5547988.1 hypothetical protein LTR23_002237 [Chaetothyriales sp. CCFEE 6169]
MDFSDSEDGFGSPKMPTTPRPVSRLTSLNNYSPFSTPKTPELSFVETPPAVEDPPTPGDDDYDSDGGAYLLGSPLAARDRKPHVLKIAGYEPRLPDQNGCIEDGEDMEATYPKSACAPISQWRIDPHDGNQQTSKSLSKGVEDASSSTQKKSESDVPVASPALLPVGKLADSCCHRKTTADVAHQVALEGTVFKNGSIKTTDELSATTATKEEPDHGTEVLNRIPDHVADTSGAEAVIEKQESIATSLVAALSSNSVQPRPLSLGVTKPGDCVATTEKGQRCRVSNGKLKEGVPQLTKADVDSLLNKVVRGGEAPQPTVVAAHIRELVSRATCSRWHQGKAQDRIEELCSYTWKVDAIPRASRAIDTMVDCVFEVWIESLKKHQPKPKNAVVLDSGPTDSWDVNFTAAIDPLATISFGKSEVSLEVKEAAIASSPATDGCVVQLVKQDVVVVETNTRVSTRGFSTHLNHKFEKFVWSRKKMALSTQELLRETIYRPLSDADMHRTGSIYVFWHTGGFGYVKIGYSKDVAERLKAWKRQCGFSLQQHNLGESVAVARVKHLHRVEALIHAELRDYRLMEPPLRWLWEKTCRMVRSIGNASKESRRKVDTAVFVFWWPFETGHHRERH